MGVWECVGVWEMDVVHVDAAVYANANVYVHVCDTLDASRRLRLCCSMSGLNKGARDTSVAWPVDVDQASGGGGSAKSVAMVVGDDSAWQLVLSPMSMRPRMTAPEAGTAGGQPSRQPLAAAVVSVAVEAAHAARAGDMELSDTAPGPTVCANPYCTGVRDPKCVLRSCGKCCVERWTSASDLACAVPTHAPQSVSAEVARARLVDVLLHQSLALLPERCFARVAHRDLARRH